MKMKPTGGISLALVIMMIFLSLCGCGAAEGTSAPAPGVKKVPPDDPPVVPGEEPAVEAHWYDDVDFGGQELVIQLSNATDMELPIVKEYIEGPSQEITGGAGSSFEKVQNAVYLRNKAATSKSKGINVTLRYIYCDKAWNSVAGYIKSAEQTYDTEDGADMYCDMVHDMMSAACENGVFANLLKYQYDKDAETQKGYFDFRKANGYYMDYMEDLALTEDRKALIASDYFLDVIRGMIVMPFNLDMYETVAAVEDEGAEGFYEDVMDGLWTWDMLMDFNNVATGTGRASLNDDRVLMALAVSGLTSTGVLYSTSFETYKVVPLAGGKVRYKLNDSCNVLYQLFRKIADVAVTHGVVCDESTTGSNQVGVMAANNKFTTGGALFACPNMLGVVETDEFQSMAKLSILPVPKLDRVSDYNTMINSRARVGALSYHSADLVAMSAFLQYCTEKSDTVKDEYFNKAMNGKYLAGSGSGEILTMIYDNIGDNKTAILDNLCIARDWDVGHENAWTALLQTDYFTGHASDISAQYKSAVTAKQSVIDEAVEAWEKCD